MLFALDTITTLYMELPLRGMSLNAFGIAKGAQPSGARSGEGELVPVFVVVNPHGHAIRDKSRDGRCIRDANVFLKDFGGINCKCHNLSPLLVVFLALQLLLECGCVSNTTKVKSAAAHGVV